MGTLNFKPNLFFYWSQKMVRFPRTLAVKNSGVPQRRRLQLRKGRTDHTILLPCPWLLSATGSCCEFCAQFTWRLQKNTLKSDTEHVNEENEFDLLLRISLGVKKKGRKIEWFQRDSHPHFTAGRKPDPQRPREESSPRWILPHRVPPHTEKQICIDIQHFLLLKTAVKMCFYTRLIVVDLPVIQESEKRGILQTEQSMTLCFPSQGQCPEQM